MATQFDFGNIFAQSLARGVQARQQRQQQEALNTFRQRSLDMQRQELSQRAQEAQRNAELMQQLRDLQRDQFDAEFTVVDDPEQAAALGVQPGARVPTSSVIDLSFDPPDIPIGEGARQHIPGLPESVDPRIGGALISALGQVNLGNIQMSGSQPPPGESLRGNVNALEARVAQLGNELANMGEFSPGYEAKLLEYRAAQRLLELAAGEAIRGGVDIGGEQNTRADDLQAQLRALQEQIQGQGANPSTETVRDPRTGRNVPLNTGPFLFGQPRESPREALRQLIMGAGPVDNLDAAIQGLPRR